jgi:hypothetical protein
LTELTARQSAPCKKATCTAAKNAAGKPYAKAPFTPRPSGIKNMSNDVQIIIPGGFIESILHGIDAEPSNIVLINSLVAKLQLINDCIKNNPILKAEINKTVNELTQATFN